MSADGGGGSSSGSGASATRPQQQQLEGRIAQPALHLSSDEVNYLVFRSVTHICLVEMDWWMVGLND